MASGGGCACVAPSALLLSSDELELELESVPEQEARDVERRRRLLRSVGINVVTSHISSWSLGLGTGSSFSSKLLSLGGRTELLAVLWQVIGHRSPVMLVGSSSCSLRTILTAITSFMQHATCNNTKKIVLYPYTTFQAIFSQKPKTTCQHNITIPPKPTMIMSRPSHPSPLLHAAPSPRVHPACRVFSHIPASTFNCTPFSRGSHIMLATQSFRDCTRRNQRHPSPPSFSRLHSDYTSPPHGASLSLVQNESFLSSFCCPFFPEAPNEIECCRNVNSSHTRV